MEMILPLLDLFVTRWYSHVVFPPLVVQWIEQETSKLLIEVRFLSRGQLFEYFYLNKVY